MQVNGQPISKTTLNHWLGIAASASAVSTTSKAVIPEPPAYTACIAHLKAIEPKPTKGQKAKTEAALKTECAQQYKELTQQVLGYLISLDWVFGASHGATGFVTPRAHVRSLLGGDAVASCSNTASIAMLVVLAVVFASGAVARTRRS